MPSGPPRNVQMCTPPRGLCRPRFPTPTSLPTGVLSFCFPHLLPIAVFSFKVSYCCLHLHFYDCRRCGALVVDLLATCGSEAFVLVLCPFLHGGAHLLRNGLESSKYTCSPAAGLSCARHPFWLLCRCASGGTSRHGHRCPGLSEEQNGERLPW